MTMHAIKGLEFDYVLQVGKRCISQSEIIEESIKA